jgi:threonine aldolase
MNALPHFASDNWSGFCPEALEYLVRANDGSAPAYGLDDWTARAADAIRELFEHDAEVFFAFNGTAANSMALAHLCQPYQAIVCHAWSHIETDECGAPGFFSHGARLLLGQGSDGKLSLDSARALPTPGGDLRFPRAAALSLTQSTEVGTLYTADELSALCGWAKAQGMRVHVDGARFMNAVVALGVSPAELSWRRGVDVLSLGASKTGGGIGDTVVFFDHELARGFDYRCKQGGQLAAKMRLMTAPLLGLIETGAWLRNARHANACAAYLEARLAGLGITPAFPCQANAVFIHLSAPQAAALRERGWPFYISDCHGAARFMCGWDTTRERIDELVNDINYSRSGTGGS